MRRGSRGTAARVMQTTHIENALAAEHKLGEPPAPAALTPAQIFAQVDTNNSGAIDFEEFAEWWTQKQAQTGHAADESVLNKIWDLFEEFDADGSRGLAPYEFSQLLDEVAKGDWRKMTDPRTGRVYYAHPYTRQTRWVEPSVEDFLRDQGIVHVGSAADLMGIEPDDHSDVHMVLNMWKIYLKSAARARSALYKDFAIYTLNLCIVFAVVLGNMPNSTSFLVHQEALTDLLLDEEFGVVDNHKKSWYDVMTPQEMWQWADGPLTEAFYGGDPALTDEAGPRSLLWTNRLIGGIQMRQIRVRPSKCPDTKWAMDPTEQAGSACSGLWRVKREARYTRRPQAHPRETGQLSTAEYQSFAVPFVQGLVETEEVPVDEDGLWWANRESTDARVSVDWTSASEWYEKWGYSWLKKKETGLKASPALVQSFIGDTSANKYGDFGYAVVLPKQGRNFVEQIRQLKGEYVCANGSRVDGLYHNETTEKERADAGDDGCVNSDGCPISEAACYTTCGAHCTWSQLPKFIDEYTRMFAVSFNLHNSNDFDEDDYEPAEKKWTNTDHMDDHLITGQVTFAFHPSGHIEKYERLNVIRPMRTFGYLDTLSNTVGAGFMVAMAIVLFILEARTLRKIGPRSYFIESENNIWNWYEIIFFCLFLNLGYATYTYYDASTRTERELEAFRMNGTIDTEYIDIFGLKSDFRSMMKAVSYYLFGSILKLFKYMNFSDNLSFVFKVVSRAKTELLGFMFVYFLIILCFAFLASTLFGYEMREFHNLASAIMSLVRLSVGLLDFDYDVMKTAEGFWAPIFLTLFVFVAMLTVVNLFISILSEYYDQVNTETAQWNDDIEIFEMQGMTVPSTDIIGNMFNLWDQLWLKLILMAEVNPPHVPTTVRPVEMLVGPTWGEGNQDDVTCYPNVFADASNLVRLHYFSEFVPVELENCRGKARANIPILGQLSEKRKFHAHCVGQGKEYSPINELIAEFGKIWDDEKWECTLCARQYQAETDGGGKTIEELHDEVPQELQADGTYKRKPWPCPGCQAGEPVKHYSEAQGREILDHVETLSSYRRCPLSEQTVACLKLHPDDMQSEVRPQVLSKLRPRYEAKQKPDKPQGDLDVDFQNPLHREPDTLDLMEDEFGARVQLECLLHETLEEQVTANGNVVGNARDSFVLFRVVQISSNEHYSGEPTALKTAEGVWKVEHDRLLWDTETGKGQARTNSQLAEKFDKAVREVELRRRFLKRLHRDEDGYPVAPKRLRMEFQPGAGLALRMWIEAVKDQALKAVSCTYAFAKCKKNFCRCKVYTDHHYKDMRHFIRKQVQYIKDNSNTKDLKELESNFLKENMSLAEAITRMKVHLVNSGKRNPARMAELYGARVGAQHMVEGMVFDETGKQIKQMMSVEEKLKRWLMSKYADEIDCVVLLHEDEAENEDAVHGR